MRSLMIFALTLMVGMSAAAASKDAGRTTLKDLQPAGVTDKKHKHQQYDLSFVSTSGKEYTCRTGEKTKLTVTDFVVGSDLNYAVNGNKAKLKTSSGKEVDCTLVRVANAPPAMK
jgi:gentisate 1,2-dioxygenase